MLGKLYSNSLLRLLNSRMSMGGGYSEPFSTPTCPEITTLPISYDHGPTPQQTSPGAKEVDFMVNNVEAGPSERICF